MLWPTHNGLWLVRPVALATNDDRSGFKRDSKARNFDDEGSRPQAAEGSLKAGEGRHKSKMSMKQDTPPGLELDEHGDPIPFDERTEGDKQKVRENIATAMQSEGSLNISEHEREIPVPIPKSNVMFSFKSKRETFIALGLIVTVAVLWGAWAYHTAQPITL